MFRTVFDKHDRFHCSSGNNLIPEKVLAVKDNGVQYLKEVGQINIYKKIQAHRDGCDMAMISKKLDPAMLSNAMSSFRIDDIEQSMINDLTAVPLTLGDALNTVKSAENLFNGLPLEVRKEFNFSTNAFIKSVGSEKFNNLFMKKKGVDQVVSSVPNVNIVSPSGDNMPLRSVQTVQEVVTQPKVKKKKKKVIEVEVDDDDE